MRRKLIFNFSHPLSPRVAEQIYQAIGPNKVIEIKVQLDLNQPVAPQVQGICAAAWTDHGNPDLIILPGHALAAVFVDRYFAKPEDDYPPCVTYKPLIRLVAEAGVTPPRFVLGGIEE